MAQTYAEIRKSVNVGPKAVRTMRKQIKREILD